MNNATNSELKSMALDIRRLSVEVIARAGSSHVGSVLSMVDIITCLYFKILNISETDPDWPDRDRFILSKGHAAAGLYTTLYKRGLLPREDLDGYYTNGGKLLGHADRFCATHVEVAAGSLGHGLPIASGMALSAKWAGRNNRHFVLMSDGECQEGSVWESAGKASTLGLSNLVAIVDYNKLQGLGFTNDIVNLEPFNDRWRSFGWNVKEIDGHDIDQLCDALDVNPADSTRPTAIIAHTVKGKGVSFMENQLLWHYRTPAGEELKAAMKELA